VKLPEPSHGSGPFFGRGGSVARKPKYVVSIACDEEGIHYFLFDARSKRCIKHLVFEINDPAVQDAVFDHMTAFARSHSGLFGVTDPVTEGEIFDRMAAMKKEGL
jgi:hypothetical protein